MGIFAGNREISNNFYVLETSKAFDTNEIPNGVRLNDLDPQVCCRSSCRQSRKTKKKKVITDFVNDFKLPH